jgi:hypothetical protein
MVGHRIELSSDSLNLHVDVDDNGSIAIATITSLSLGLLGRLYLLPPLLETVLQPERTTRDAWPPQPAAVA